jgi:DNA adenine methylase
MSINDVPEIREMFADFTIQAVPTKYSLGSSAVRRVTELLVMNYQPGKG